METFCVYCQAFFFGHNLLAPLSLPNSPISEGLPSRLGINSVFSPNLPISEGLESTLGINSVIFVISKN